jgi:hypothetical protein
MANEKLGEAYVEMELRDKQYQRSLKTAEKKTSTSTKKMGKSVDTLGSKFSALGKTALGVAGALGIGRLVSVGKEWVQLSNVQEAAVTKLNAALKKEGIFSEGLSKQIQGLASEIQGLTTEGDEATLSNTALAINLGHLSETVIPKAMKAAVGLSRIMGVDATTAFQLLGRAATGNTTLFTRYGITLDETLTAQEKFNELLRMGVQGFQLAEAEARDTSGRMTQLGNSIGDLKESFGDLIKDALEPSVGWLTTLVQSLDDTAKAIRTTKGAIGTTGLLGIGSGGQLPGQLTARTTGATSVFPGATSVNPGFAAFQRQQAVAAITGARRANVTAPSGRRAVGTADPSRLPGLAPAQSFSQGLGPMGLLGIEDNAAAMNDRLKEQLKQDNLDYLEETKQMQRDFWHWELENTRLQEQGKFDIKREYLSKISQLLFQLSGLPGGVGRVAGALQGVARLASGFFETKSLIGSLSNIGGGGGTGLLELTPAAEAFQGHLPKAATTVIDLRGSVLNSEQLLTVVDSRAVDAVVTSAREGGPVRDILGSRARR